MVLLLTQTCFLLIQAMAKCIKTFPRFFSPFTGNSEKFSFKWFSILPVIPAVYRP
jgi:hypothetical protein